MSEKITVTDRDALIAVDLQNDFCPGGSLAVKDGDQVVPVINRIRDKFKTRVYTRDWHPADHMSFSDEPAFVDKSWPPHCVRDTKGAEWCQDLEVPDDAIIVNKATQQQTEAYSGFQGTDLAGQLKARGVARVFVGGLATDYCVRFTVEDAIKAGFAAVVIEDASRPVDVPPGNGKQALQEMKQLGARIIVSADLA